MANKLYVLGLDTLLNAWASPRITDVRSCKAKALLVRGYTFDHAHHYVSDLTASGATIVARTPDPIDIWTSFGYDLPGPPYLTASLLFGVDLVNFGAVAAGDPCTAVVFYFAGQNSTDADWPDTGCPLFSHVDTATGLPYTPNGTPVTVSFGSGYYLGGIKV